MLCGVPNHGVYAWDAGLNNEFNGRGPFLRGLNEGDSEVTPGTAFLTLRSDGYDKYAQSDGRFVGKPGTSTGITAEGPALRGATNLVLGTLDHRETAYHPRAFREIFKFIAGREPFKLNPRDPALFFVQRLRDEAHRFVIGSHRKLRKKDIREAGLQEIPGIGPSRKRALLHHFGTLKEIERASISDLGKVPGVSAESARKIFEFFHAQPG